MKPLFFNVIAEFAMWPKTNDVTLDFFNFLENNYPNIWENLNIFYADDYTWHKEGEYYNPRLALFEWDRDLQPENFGMFLLALKTIWNFLTDNDYGVCCCCEQETYIDTEHHIIKTYEIGPIIKFNHHYGFDGGAFREELICRECATKTAKSMIEKMSEEGATFYA